MTAHPFSPAGRMAALEAMAAREVDLLIIGGGITGCGLAREAALRGLSVALVERDDFGCGTSGRSSKLIHGGLRYLAYGDFRMVREAARERQVLRKIAPHLVHPLPFLMPVWNGYAKYRLALWLFDRLSGVSDEDRHRHLDAQAVAERLPGIRKDGLKGGLLYGEYVTDDARLTLENALSAAEHGALVANHARAVTLDQDRGRVVGATVCDALTDQVYRVKARLTVNATGPWAARTLGGSGLTAPKALFPSKGIHLLFAAERLPIEGALALNAPSGRAGFAIRRWGYVYVGTTDDPYDGPLDAPAADSGAVGALLSLVQECFPALHLTSRDIVGTWAGLRPLIAEPGKSARDTSRHDEVWAGPDGLLTVAGGKLTTYRPTSRRVMTYVEHALRLPPAAADRSATVPLPGAGAPVRLDIDPQTQDRISWLYGSRTRHLPGMGSEWLAPLAPGVPVLRGEVRLAVEQEMALTLTDFLDRRSSLLLFSQDRGFAAAEATAALMGDLLGWSEQERARQLERYRTAAIAHGTPSAE